MDERYLRIEAVNMATTVYDTQDLGATQGASLALLKAPWQVAEKLGLKPEQVEHIGASQGLFRVPAALAEDLATQARNFLRNTDPFRHLCFVVDVAQSEEQAIALNRFRQMQELSIPLPDGVGAGCCPVDRMRPSGRAWDREEDRKISESVKARRVYRRNERQRFYEDEIGLSIPDEDWSRFAHSFGDIVKTYPTDEPEARHNPPPGTPEALLNKMAVLYFDGNRFGDIRTTTGARIFGEILRPLRLKVMDRLLSTIDGGVKRLETLLWGGDEMVWVVPSWQVWPVLTAFFDATRDWPHGMTHAGGVVVCHHKTPIRQVVALAHDLADRAKATTRTANAIQIEILESLDIPERYLDRQRRALFGTGVNDDAFTLRGEDWTALTARLIRIRAEDGFPRSQLYRLLRKTRDDQRALTRPVGDELAAVLLKGKYPALEDGDLCADPVDLARIATFWDYVR